MAPEMPSYMSGFALLDADRVYMGASSDLHAMIAEYNAGGPIGAVDGCPGSCVARILAPALAVDSCSSEISYSNFSQPLTAEQNATYDQGLGSAPYDYIVFGTSLGILSGDREGLALKTVIAQTPGNSTCAASVNTTTCRLVSAIAEYPVLVKNSTFILTEPQPYPQIVALANNTALTKSTIAQYG